MNGTPENRTIGERFDEAHVARWPGAVARRIGLGVGWIATAMLRAGIITEDEDDRRLAHAFSFGEYTPEVAALTEAQAKAVYEAAQAIKRDLVEEARTSCYSCGRTLPPSRVCDQCGDQLD